MRPANYTPYGQAYALLEKWDMPFLPFTVVNRHAIKHLSSSSHLVKWTSRRFITIYVTKWTLLNRIPFAPRLILRITKQMWSHISTTKTIVSLSYSSRPNTAHRVQSRHEIHKSNSMSHHLKITTTTWPSNLKKTWVGEEDMQQQSIATVRQIFSMATPIEPTELY